MSIKGKKISPPTNNEVLKLDKMQLWRKIFQFLTLCIIRKWYHHHSHHQHKKQGRLIYQQTKKKKKYRPTSSQPCQTTQYTSKTSSLLISS
jgi:hypothetical protein